MNRQGMYSLQQNEIGVNVEYFANEFMETSSVRVHESDYLNIAMFNAMFWEW